MARPPARIQLTAEEESTLREWTRKGTGEQRLADRARIVLLSHEGMTVEKIAEHLHTRPARISKWRQRFVEGRLNALSDAPRPGKPHTYTEETERRVLRLLDQAPPEGYAQWNGPLLARSSGRRQHRSCMAHTAQAPDPVTAPAKLVHQHRSGVRAEGGRRGGAVSESAGERAAVVGG